jgi:hypothetical protein
MLCCNIIFADEYAARSLMDEAECMRCHATSDFEPKEEKVNSYEKLDQQVSVCASNNFAGWFEEDVTTVSDYLNINYYKFHREH